MHMHTLYIPHPARDGAGPCDYHVACVCVPQVQSVSSLQCMLEIKIHFFLTFWQ